MTSVDHRYFPEQISPEQIFWTLVIAHLIWSILFKESLLLTESTVERMFRELMNEPQRNEEIFEKAEELLEEELRPESPLRHRLSVELEELRTLATKE